jgi:hypothetical protein
MPRSRRDRRNPYVASYETHNARRPGPDSDARETSPPGGAAATPAPPPPGSRPDLPDRVPDGAPDPLDAALRRDQPRRPLAR